MDPIATSTAQGIAARQRAFFSKGETQTTSFRTQQLRVLRDMIVRRERDILDALRRDLGKPETEAYVSELAVVLHEIDWALTRVRSWARPRRVRTPVILFPATSWIYPQPYGSVLIIGPFNYPFQLAVLPLVGALAAGNCAVVKPSEVAPHTARLISEMIGASFDPAYLAVVEGGVEETQVLLADRFDYILFTGSSKVGRIVMAAAATHLTPVTLELGGKNPCIVDADADLDKAARRIAWGKFINAGQTCIAPDFVLAHRSIKPALVQRLSATIDAFFGADPMASADFGRIINDKHFARLASLMHEGDVVIGGRAVAEQRYIAPTVIDNVSWNHPVMQEEIFGPILPVLDFDTLEETIEVLEGQPKPLAVYYFSSNRARQDEVLRRLRSGGACINDTFAQMLNPRLPFGGVGDSGLGAYHGKTSFDTFSHFKSVVKRSTWADPGFKYPPYKTPLSSLRRITRLIY